MLSRPATPNSPSALTGSLSRGCRLWILVAAMLLSSFGLTREVRAQGTADTLPNPISVSEFDRYINRLKLSSQQQIAAEAMHESYQDEFRALREGPIEAFLAEMREMQGAGMSLPRRDQLEEFLDSMERVRARIRALDNRFFDQVQTILNEDQLMHMHRVRMERQRIRFNTLQQLAMMGAGLAPDLSDQVLRRLNLSDAEMETVDPILAEYESKLTRSYHELYSTVTNMYLKMFDAMEDIGYDEQTMQDPQRAREMMQAMQTVIMDIMSEARVVSTEMHELNARTYRSIHPLMDALNGERFLELYYSSSYPELGQILSTNIGAFESALTLEDLSGDQRERLEDLGAATRAERDATLTKLADVIDTQRANMNPFDMSQNEELRELTTTRQELMEELMILGDAAQQQLIEVLSSEQYDAVMAMRSESSASAAQPLVPTPIGVAGRATPPPPPPAEIITITHGPDTFLPPAITRGNVIAWSTRLNLSDTDRTIFDGLFEDYLARQEELVRGPIQAVQDAAGAVWSYDADTAMTVHNGTSAIDALYEARRTALASMLALESDFFVGMEAAVITDDNRRAFELIKLDRLKEVYNRGGGRTSYAQFGVGLDSYESDLDLRRLLRTSRGDDLSEFDGILMEYERELTDLFKEKYEARMQLQRARDGWSARVYELQQQNSGDEFASITAEYLTESRDLMEEPESRHLNVREAIAMLNRRTVDAIADRMNAIEGESLRQDYHRATFPGVYSDQLYATPYLRAALGLDGLPSTTADRIDSLLVEYDPEYLEHSERMVDLAREGFEVSMSFDPESVQELQRRAARLERIRFERTQLNQRALRRLRQLLTEEQIRALNLPKLGE